MPPRKGIVKTGNSGNSSKSSKLPPKPEADPNAEKPLFPPGSKTPLSLLNERCQKNGWDRPIIDTRRKDNGYLFSVTLSRPNKKDPGKEMVVLFPHEPYICPTALEARHWGATYALYRFCNGIQLHLVLPPGPKEYWAELSLEHKKIPEHQKWMYSADPFAAKKEVADRQKKAAAKNESAQETSTAGPSSRPPAASKSRNEFSSLQQVKMATDLREFVEDAIKKAIALYPDTVQDTPATLSPEETSAVSKQLLTIGFKQAYVDSAISFLSNPSAMASNFLSSLTPLEAAIEYLILHLPEIDLPKRFLSDSKYSQSFVTSAHSGRENLEKRWLEDRAVKVAGWPEHVVRGCTTDPQIDANWDLLLGSLGRKLIGADPTDDSDETSPYDINPEEAESFGALYETATHVAFPLFNAPITLHIELSPPESTSRYPRPGFLPMYLTSESVPAYIRLHLLASLLGAMGDPAVIKNDGGFFPAAMRVLEETWADVEDQGPPNIAEVLKHLAPQAPSITTPVTANESTSAARKGPRKGRGGSRPRDARDSVQVKRDYESMLQTSQYRTLLATRENLPAFKSKEEFLKMLHKSRIVLVVGETGCGKTTQLPQFILDSLITSSKGDEASIIVTQPRRLSAIGVSSRVSAERAEDGSVGYAIRGESTRTPKTKLLFCTTGVVLRRLSSGDSLNDVTHIVVDEVHERSVDGDFLLLELKDLLKRHPTLKVVLMSATLNHKKFLDYFEGAPLLSIPGITHPVEDLYLEDLMPKISYRPAPQRSTKKTTSSERDALSKELGSLQLDKTTTDSIRNVIMSDRIDYQLVAAAVQHIMANSSIQGGVLIFLPGVSEIRNCLDAVRKTVGAQFNADFLPLHANLSNVEQRRVFQKTKGWKVIASTNVAETSITIDDVIYVVDTGKVKETRYDAENGIAKLVECWITKAAARQRRGRAGRTRPGVCYKLYTKRQVERMDDFQKPEILRVPLESLALSIKTTREDEDVKSFLRRAIDPPDLSAIDNAWNVLEDLGAINSEGGLTALGRHMALIPVDLRLAKILVLGSIFRCLDPVLTIAAMLSSKPLFTSPLDKQAEATQARAVFATGESDLLTDLNAYDHCAKLRAEGSKATVITKFCEDNFISMSTIRDITSLRTDFLSSLTDLGFIPWGTSPSSPELSGNGNNVNLLKTVILGGLYPRIARVHLPDKFVKYDQVSAGTIKREQNAKEFRMYDCSNASDERVFLHPGSVLFGVNAWKTGYLAYFQKRETSKIFIQSITEVPMYALLLLGGSSVSVNQILGGITIRTSRSIVKLAAGPKIGILVNQLRRLLDAELQRCIEEGQILSELKDSPVMQAILALLANDGLTRSVF